MTVALVDSTRRHDRVRPRRRLARVPRARRQLVQLTDDHSLVGELMRSGKLSPEEAESHPQRSVITRALGTEPDIDVDTFTVEARADDLFLLCSDGLTDMISRRTRSSPLLERSDRSGAAARALVEAANARRRRGQHHRRRSSGSATRRGRQTAQIPSRRAGDDDEDTLRASRRCPSSTRPSIPARRRGTPAGGRRTPPRARAAPEAPAARLLLVLLVVIVALLLWGLCPLSLRNRELLNLIAVGLLTAIGFASVYIARSSLVDATSLTYAGIFLGALPRGPPRRAVRRALRRPGVAAAGRVALGDRRDDDLPAESRRRLSAGALGRDRGRALRADADRCCAATTGGSRATSTCSGSLARAAALPAIPGIGQTINGARLWVKVGSFQFQPGELAKIMLIVFLAGYLRDKREVLAQGRLKDFGPLFLIWGAAMLVLVRRTTSAAPCSSSGSSSRWSTSRPGAPRTSPRGLVALHRRLRAVYQYVDHVRERVTIWLQPWTTSRSTAPRPASWRCARTAARSSSSRASTRSATAASAAPGSAAAPSRRPTGDPIIP